MLAELVLGAVERAEIDVPSSLPAAIRQSGEVRPAVPSARECARERECECERAHERERAHSSQEESDRRRERSRSPRSGGRESTDSHRRKQRH